MIVKITHCSFYDKCSNIFELQINDSYSFVFLCDQKVSTQINTYVQLLT